MKNTNVTGSENDSLNPSSSIDESQLLTLLVNGLQDVYWSEKKLIEAIPQMISNATSPELAETLEEHLTETEGHVVRLESVFKTLEEEASERKCEAMAGLLKAGEQMMAEAEGGAMRDATIIAAAQKIEHYEIASYGTLRAFATALGYDDVAELLDQTLEEEKQADENLTEVALSEVNPETLGRGDDTQA